MDEILGFQNYVDGGCAYHDTIQGEKFRALMDLCFARADQFSLIRRDWPGARDGPLERALRPYRLGEYDSYGRLIWFNHEAREKCYLYPAGGETKAILLAHITHLFGRDVERPEGSDWMPEKYKKCVETSEAAWDRIIERWDALGGAGTDEARGAIEEEELREAKALWLPIFDEADFQSNMEDPCFFRGDEMFFETITHEYECRVHVLDRPFGKKLRELERWRDLSDQFRLPLGLLSRQEGLVWYGAGKTEK